MKKLLKKILLLFSMVLCLAGVFCRTFMVKAETEDRDEDNQFDIQAETALGNYVKTGRYSQMKVTITNHGENFNGLVQIITVVNSNNIMNQKSFSIGSGKTTDIEIPFRMQSTYGKILVRIVDMSEKVLQKKEIKVTVVNCQDYFVGVLTNSKQDMGYLESYAKISWLDENRMPDTTEEMDALDRIYINSFQTAKLSKEQYEVLKTWVEEGGDLVIGTGVNADAVLGIFQDEFLKGKVGEQTEGNRAELFFEGEKVYQNKKENYNIHSLSVGKGSIWVYDVDIGVSNKEWKEAETKYINYQLEQQFGTTKFPNKNEDALYLQEAINIKDASKLPNISLYGIIFFIYIICVSFVIYFILKKGDEMEKTWIAVPMFSLFFVIVVICLGSTTRITKPYMMYQGEVCFSGGNDTNPQEKNILQLSSASNKDYTLAIPEGRMMYSEQEYIGESNGKISSDFYKVGFYQGEEHQYVMVKNVSAFEKDTLISEQKRNMGKGYESNIASNKFQCEGTFTNHTGYTLKYAVLKTMTEFYVLGTIKDGETIEINKENAVSQYGHIRNLLMKLLFGTKDVQKLTVEAMRYQKVLWERALYTLEDGYSGEICACIDLEEDKEKMNREWGIECDGITNCEMPVEINYTCDGELFVPNLLLEAEDVDGVIDEDWAFDYSKTQSVDIKYTLEKEETLTGIYYLKDGNPYMEEDVYSGEILAYNYNSKKYETIFEGGKEKSIRKVSDYVNQKNVLKIRFKTDKRTKESEAWQYLPTISLSIKETE